MLQLKSFLLITLSFFVAAQVVSADPSYKLNPGDVLRIGVWNEESLNRELVIRPDGYINFPLAGAINIGGKTTTEAESLIATGLGTFLKDVPTVTVAPIELNGNKVFVLGKVNRPGQYPINRPTDVMQALAIAGGLNAFASENNINVLRRLANGEQISIQFEYGDVKDGENLESNIVLQSGDVVVVP